MSITFRIGKDDITRNKHMSITFRIGKDENTRNKPDQTLGNWKVLAKRLLDTKALVGY